MTLRLRTDITHGVKETPDTFITNDDDVTQRVQCAIATRTRSPPACLVLRFCEVELGHVRLHHLGEVDVDVPVPYPHVLENKAHAGTRYGNRSSTM